MQRKVPKNIRQIGYANDNDKVYMEDYVDTYLNQLCDKANDHAEGAFLIGEQIMDDGKRHTYIYGAVKMNEIETAGGKPNIPDAAYEMAKEECEKYFSEGVILGWFLAADGYASGVDANLVRQHEKYMGKPNTFLLMREPDGGDENFYIYRSHELQRLNGHYIYYEKNPSMQNYMIDQRRGVGIETKNAVTDEATQNFRQILQQKEKKRPDTGSMHRLSYALSTVLVLIVLAMGIGAFNNYDGLAGLRGVTGAFSENVNSKDESVGSQNSVSKDADAEAPGNADAQRTSLTEQDENADNTDIQSMDTAEADAQNTDSGTAEAQNVGSDTAEADAQNTGSGTAEADAQNAGSDTASTQNTVDNNVRQSPSEGNYYTVKKGDTLAGISRKMYGTASKVKDICNINNISDVNLIIEGQKIILP